MITDENAGRWITEMLNECAERLGTFPGAKVDQRAWVKLLAYAPKSLVVRPAEVNDPDSEYAPDEVHVSEAEMEALKASWSPEDTWQRRRAKERWRDLPVGCGYQPGWFFDTQYRKKPTQEG